MLLCAAPTPAKFPQWIAERGSELGLVVTEDAAHALFERLGPDQRRLVRELEKLACYAPEGGRVDRETVEALTVSDLEVKAYELADAVIEGDRERALRVCEDMRERGEEIMHILFAILRQLRQAREGGGDARRRGVDAADRIGAARASVHREADRRTGRARADARQLERALEELAELDYAVRGAANRDAGTALTADARPRR